MSDATTEAIAVLLEQNPRGMLLARDELSGWLASFDQYRRAGGADCPAWLQLHGARTLTIDRKTGARQTIRVRRAAVSVCGTTQPQVLARRLTREFFESGFASRLLLAMPPKRLKRWTESELKPGTYDAYDLIVRKLLALEHAANSDGRPIPIDVPLSKEAKRIFEEFYNEHGQRQFDTADTDLEAAFSKLEGAAMRFALLFHLVEMVCGGMGNEIGPNQVKAGIELARWFCSETERIYVILKESEDDSERKILVAYIKNKGGQITPRELTRSNRKYGPTEVARNALDGLVAAGIGRFVVRKPGPKGGQPMDVFTLFCQNDSGHDDAITDFGVQTTVSSAVGASTRYRHQQDKMQS